MDDDRPQRPHAELRDSSDIQQLMTANHVLWSLRGLSQVRRVCAIAALTLACIFSAHSAELSIEIHGLSPELQEAARASLELNHYVERDVSDSQIRRLFSRADEQIRSALEPFGYYHVRISSDLARSGDTAFKAEFTVDAGAPVTVTQTNVRVTGTAADLPEVKAAVESFKPKSGEPLDHGIYEASKSRIDTAIRSAGYLDARLVEHRVAVARDANSAEIDLTWEGGARYRFGEVRFSPSQFREGLLQRYLPWKPGDDYSAEQLVALQQLLVDADYFASVAVQPLVDQRAGGTVPVEVLVVPAKRTLYTAGVYVSTDTGPGVRFGMDRRWVNERGHKMRGDVQYSQRLKGVGITYQIPRPGPDNRSYNLGTAYSDEETDTSHSRMLRIAGNDSRNWRGFVRTVGLQYLNGDYEIADERHSSSLLYAEGVLNRKKADDLLFTAHGYSLALGVRGAPQTALSDTSFLQLTADGKWIQIVGDNGRVIVHAGLGAMEVEDFDALPPELRFFAGGDRTVRGFGYEEIGETNTSGGVIGGKYLAYAGTEYEHYFLPKWGAAVFADAGDAFSSSFDANVSVGVGVRWKSPIGVVRLDIAKPVVTDLDDGWRIHVIIGPDL